MKHFIAGAAVVCLSALAQGAVVFNSPELVWKGSVSEGPREVVACNSGGIFTVIKARETLAFIPEGSSELVPVLERNDDLVGNQFSHVENDIPLRAVYGGTGVLVQARVQEVSTGNVLAVIDETGEVVISLQENEVPGGNPLIDDFVNATAFVYQDSAGEEQYALSAIVKEGFTTSPVRFVLKTTDSEGGANVFVADLPFGAQSEEVSGNEVYFTIVPDSFVDNRRLKINAAFAETDVPTGAAYEDGASYFVNVLGIADSGTTTTVVRGAPGADVLEGPGRQFKSDEAFIRILEGEDEVLAQPDYELLNARASGVLSQIVLARDGFDNLVLGRTPSAVTASFTGDVLDNCAAVDSLVAAHGRNAVVDALFECVATDGTSSFSPIECMDLDFDGNGSPADPFDFYLAAVCLSQPEPARNLDDRLDVIGPNIGFLASGLPLPGYEEFNFTNVFAIGESDNGLTPVVAYGENPDTGRVKAVVYAVGFGGAVVPIVSTGDPVDEAEVILIPSIGPINTSGAFAFRVVLDTNETAIIKTTITQKIEPPASFVPSAFFIK